MPPTDGTRRVRVALLDDHELLLDSLAAWIREREPGFELVVAARSWAELVHDPGFPTDLVLMDLGLPERVSIESRVRTCRAAGAKVIVLTALDTEEDRTRALAAGAAAYLTKAQPIREVMVVARSLTGARGPDAAGGGAGPRHDDEAPRLSDGELRTLRFYVQGLTMRQTAERMNVKYETVKTYLRRVREKYAAAGRPASTRGDLERRAAEDGIAP